MLACFFGIAVIDERERLLANRKPGICRGIVVSPEQFTRKIQPSLRDCVFAAKRIVIPRQPHRNARRRDLVAASAMVMTGPLAGGKDHVRLLHQGRLERPKRLPRLGTHAL